MELLRGKPYKLNDKITIYQPTLGEIEEYGEIRYLQLVSNLTATSYDCRFQLDDMGIDYEDIDDFTMFCMMFKLFKIEDTKILFGDLDFQNFELMVKDESEIVIRDNENDINIDPIIYELIVSHLRQVHGLKRNYLKAGNKMAREFLLKEERRNLELQMQNKKNDDNDSQYAPLIVSMVNCAEFKYDYESVFSLPIYTFMESIKQVQKMIGYKNLMIGIYTGNIDSKNIPKEEKTWISE